MIWRHGSRRFPIRLACGKRCAGSPPGRITSARRTTRTTPSGCSAQFKAWGWDAQIETFDVLFPTPKERVVELVAPTTFQGEAAGAALRRAIRPRPARRAAADLQRLLASTATSPAPLVYVNYGMPDDYEELERRGISVKGAIVIASYGGSWRGIKPKVAAEHGAVGCLIYSDPRDDGYAGGDVFPKGPMRPRDGVQRGSVAGHADVSRRSAHAGRRRDARTRSGSPSPKRRRSRRFRCCRFPTATRSRCSPRSADRVAAAAWRGGLPITYHFGPGPARVHLKVKSDWSLKTLYDVIARIRRAPPKPTSGSFAATITTPG